MPAAHQPKPRLFDSSISELKRSSCEPGGEPCVTFLATAPGGNQTEILLTLRELRRLARWCNWEPKKTERVTWPDYG